MAGPPCGPAIPLPAAKCHHGRWYPCSTAGIPGAVASPRRAARGPTAGEGPPGMRTTGPGAVSAFNPVYAVASPPWCWVRYRIHWLVPGGRRRSHRHRWPSSRATCSDDQADKGPCREFGALPPRGTAHPAEPLLTVTDPAAQNGYGANQGANPARDRMAQLVSAPMSSCNSRSAALQRLQGRAGCLW